MITAKVGQAMTTAVNRHNEKRQKRLIVFYKAIEITKKHIRQWSHGESKTIFKGTLQGKPAEIYLRNEGSINLYLFVEGETLMKRFYSEPFKVGYFSPATGYKVSANITEDSYLQWNMKTRREISG
jgi:hypothetical protein